MNKKISRLLIGLFAALCLSTSVLAANIQVITSGAFAEALKALVPEYEKQSPN
jgi:molybdate transport system substrate-binding protein